MSATITTGVFAGMTREALTTTRAKLQQALLDLAMGEKTVSVGYAAGGLSSRTATFTAADEARIRGLIRQINTALGEPRRALDVVFR
jgi:hypothetical protein